MLKAVREAKVHTSWINAERGVRRRGLGVCRTRCWHPSRRNLFLKDLAHTHSTFAWFGMLNSLSMTLLKLTSPGRARHLPGQRNAGPEPGRSGQPPAGGLRAACAHARRAGDARTRRATSASRHRRSLRPLTRRSREDVDRVARAGSPTRAARALRFRAIRSTEYERRARRSRNRLHARDTAARRP